MMDIIDHIGTVSGIDAGIYDAADAGTAQKIITRQPIAFNVRFC